MTVLYMIDTNTVSYIVKGNSPAARHKLMHLRAADSSCISSITAAEIYFGLSRNQTSGAFQAAMKGFLAKISILPWGLNEARVYGDLRAKQETLGKPLESMDMMIAAHGIAVGAVLVTHDAVFQQVADLGASIDWATDI